jgi:NAD(P)-dependent dehydrogenase (short-subunit alcohol dehydrogenase family)
VQRTAVVTGAARGVGRGIAEQLVAEDWQVVLADVDASAIASTAAVLGARGAVESVVCDVSIESEVIALMARAGAVAAGGLDGLVTCAGIANPGRTPIEAQLLEHWDRMLAVNLTGTMLCVKHAVPLLRGRQGSVVTMSSTRAHQSEPNTEAYSASKGGVLALTHALAISLGPAIRVNCVSPGWIDTSATKPGPSSGRPTLRPVDHWQHPVGRVGIPADVAMLVALLLSSATTFITGQEFVVDGGMTVKMIYED